MSPCSKGNLAHFAQSNCINSGLQPHFWLTEITQKQSSFFAADWNHPFHCSADSLSAAGSGSSLVVLAPLLHSGKYRFIYFYLISIFLAYR